MSNFSIDYYKLGRLYLAMPNFMLPQICKFDYTWDSRTSHNESHHLGYPISLQEYPYSNKDNKKNDWNNNIIKIKNINKSRILFAWDVSSMFKLPAYFICLNKEAALFCYYVILLEKTCILHLIARKTFRYPKKPEKGTETEQILYIILNLYNNYRTTHASYYGNIFYTYYGEVIDNKFNFNEKMYIVFKNKQNNLTCAIHSHTNPLCRTEKDLENLMKRIAGGGLSLSKMRSIPNFPGKCYETLEKNDENFIYSSLYYYGPCRSIEIPSFSIDATKKASADKNIFIDMWNVIINNIRPLA